MVLKVPETISKCLNHLILENTGIKHVIFVTIYEVVKQEFSLLLFLQFWLSYSESVGKVLNTLKVQGKAAAITHSKRSFHLPHH